jgi:tetratricopeptide (TPR) repeat protein
MPLLRAGRSEDPRVRREQLELLVQERPYFVEAKLTLAVARVRQGDLDGGKQIYFEVLRANPSMRNSPLGQNLRNLIGLVYEERAQRAYMVGNWDEALAGHREVFNIEPPDPKILSEAHNGYAWTLVDKLNREYKEAEKHAEIGLRLQPDAAHIIDTLAWAYFKQGRYQEALDTQLRAVEELKKNKTRSEPAEYYYHLGAIYERLGDKAKSAANYSQALTLQAWRFPQAEQGLRRVAPNALPPPAQRRIPVFPRRRDPSEDRGLI